MTQGRRPDESVAKYFTFVVDADQKKWGTCKLCSAWKNRSHNSSREKQHLKGCPGHQELEAAESRATALKQQKIDKSFTAKDMKKQLADERAAEAVYASNRPFSLYDTPEFRILFSTFGYVPPTRKRLAGELLDSTFLKVQERVKALVDKWIRNGVGIISDESTNVNGNRIQNICVVLPDAERTVLLWNAAEVISKLYNADEIVKWLILQANDITSNRPEKIISFSSDTCQTMISAGKKLRFNPGFEQVEWIPCDSHGLQLLVQDICEDLPLCVLTLQSATKWIKAFSKAPKQLHILRSHQKQKYGRHKALIKSVITRWGTQVSITSFIMISN